PTASATRRNDGCSRRSVFPPLSLWERVAHPAPPRGHPAPGTRRVRALARSPTRALTLALSPPRGHPERGPVRGPFAQRERERKSLASSTWSALAPATPT